MNKYPQNRLLYCRRSIVDCRLSIADWSVCGSVSFMSQQLWGTHSFFLHCQNPMKIYSLNGFLFELIALKELSHEYWVFTERTNWSGRREEKNMRKTKTITLNLIQSQFHIFESCFTRLNRPIYWNQTETNTSWCAHIHYYWFSAEKNERKIMA